MRASWTDRYKLSISENMTIKDISLLLDIGMNKANEIRKESIKYCACNEIETYTRSVPTEVVLIIANKSVDYYYQKMLLETKIVY